jgi:AraC family transcriptional regulator
MQVHVEYRQPVRIAFLRHVGSYSDVHVTWEKLREWAKPRGLLGPAAEFIGVSHDDPITTSPERIRYDAGLVVEPSVERHGRIDVQELEGGDYAVVIHRGPYWQLPDVYSHIYNEWMPGSGYQPRNLPAYEVYRDDPEVTMAGDLLTDVCVPVERVT